MTENEQLVGDASKLRIGAMFIDNGLLSISALATGAFFAEASVGPRSALIVSAAFGYFLIQEAVWSTTIGKAVFGLRVIRTDGLRSGWREAFWRTLLRFLEVNPILLGALPGALAVMASKKNQRLGDYLAGTYVVKRDAVSHYEAVKQSKQSAASSRSSKDQV
jgi:uncharacterized RDD family membrane protein YckC